MTFAAHQLDCGVEARVFRHRVNLHQRHHRLARLGVGESEDAADHAPLERQDRISAARPARAWRAPLQQQLQILAAQEHAFHFGGHADDAGAAIR